MKIVHIVNVFASAMLIIVMTSVTVAIWAAKQSDFHNHRITLAHNSFAQHLQLKADTYLMFKRFGDLLLVGNEQGIQEGKDISLRLKSHIEGIRETIEEEIRTVGNEELEELELLGEVETVINELVSLFEQALTRDDISDVRSNWRKLSLTLNDNIKNDFSGLITVALEEEKEEVAETEEKARTETEFVRRISTILAVFTILIVSIALFVFRLQFIHPFKLLLDGTRKFADGDFTSSINLQGRSELPEVATVLNKMSDAVAAKTNMLTSQNFELEQAVKKRTESLEKLLEEARLSEKMRRRLLADVSHELRTPLTVIQGEADIALRGKDKTADEYKEALRRAGKAASHTANLVSDLLFISRKESGTLNLSTQQTNLIDLIEEVNSISDVQAEYNFPDSQILIQVDEMRIKQALLALLENAKHHGGEKIIVTVSSKGSFVELAVTDNGPGLNETENECVFERFFRGSNSAERYADGLGLGLPIVRAIAEAHGGTAIIDSSFKDGLRVVLKLPAKSI